MKKSAKAQPPAQLTLHDRLRVWLEGAVQGPQGSKPKVGPSLVFCWTKDLSLLKKQSFAQKLARATLSDLEARPGQLVTCQLDGQWWLLVQGTPPERRRLGEEDVFALGVSVYFRDIMGVVVQTLESQKLDQLELQLFGANDEIERAMAKGLEIALYRYRRGRESLPIVHLHGFKSTNSSDSRKAFSQGQLRGRAINLARHLVNLPPNLLHPKSFAEWIFNEFSAQGDFKVEVWEKGRLEKEQMGLHLAVGRGAESGPRLVCLHYRPAKVKAAPIALVGKGITFDSGGLDIKPSSAMRLMKKDMGGAAAVAAVAWYVAQTSPEQPFDFYLPLAENAIDKKSFRPSDVLKARNGLEIEIHNTDAEGRLVLADALDVAVTKPDKPQIVIDVATLTGAIKIGLGSQVAGLFSNSNELRQGLQNASQRTADHCWPMPLYQNYRSLMQSPFAHMTNSVDGFGGAITAALFLESFVREVPWAHFDIYAWKDKAEGAWLEPGGSGQGVDLLIDWIEQRGHKNSKSLGG